MAAEEAAAITADAGAGEALPLGGAPKRPRRRLILVIAGALSVLVVAGGAGAYLTGLLDPVLGGGAEEAGSAGAPPAPAARVLHDLPEFIVNLNAAGPKSRFLKVKARLELSDASAVKEVENTLPRIIDAFQVYLREMRPDDLEGSAGTARLREALLRRVAVFVGPDRVTDVLFVEIFMQ